MNNPDSKIDRLFRAAAQSREAEGEMPFGFDTRVLALARQQPRGNGGELWEFTRILQRIAVGAAIVLLGASSAAYWQMQQNNEWADASTNSYAIADSAIETGAF